MVSCNLLSTVSIGCGDMTLETPVSRLPKSFQKDVDANESLRRLVVRILRQGGSVETAQAYVYDAVEFAKYLGGTPDEVLSRERDWARTLNEHLDSLVVERGVSPASAQRRVSGVKRWLRINEVKADWEKVEVPKKQVVEADQLPTRDELKALYDAADLFDRVLMLTAISSGMRVGAIASVQLKHVDLTKDIPTVKVPKEMSKGGKSYMTFITPEAKKALMAYLKQREMRGEVLTPDSYLLACERPRGKRVAKHSLTWHWKTLLKKTGLDGKATRRNVDGREVPAKRNLRHIHTLRKFFKTWASLSGMNGEVLEYTMGHRSGVRTVYFIPDDASQVPEEIVAKLTAEYSKAVGSLTIFNEGEQVKELTSKVEEQARQLQAERERFEAEKLAWTEQFLALAKTVEGLKEKAVKPETPGEAGPKQGV